MNCKIILFCALLALENANGFVKRDVMSTTSNSIVDSFQHSIDGLRDCVDKTLAAAVSEVDEKQLQPIFTALGEQVNKFSKAFAILTAPTAISKK